ncbi:RNaseH domain-containing protein [Actinoallomurus sp. NPDC052274]|uniref:RNaseH domain-containing protein n=1 Tax=Actinoallomurus sp. NPDC052274 TaxID=3155420 RepID=UPI0034357D73
MILTTGFRIPRSLLGELHVYVLPHKFRQELDVIGRIWRRDQEHARAPHASLAVALRAVTGQPVRILPRTRWKDGEVFLITTRPIAPDLLATAVRFWERLARREEGKERDTNALAPMLAQITSHARPIAEAIDTPQRGRLEAENWVYEVLGWITAERLISQPVPFDQALVPFRIDTDGTAIAWDTPIARPGRNGTARALMKVTPRIKTLPGVSDLVCILDVSLTRLEDNLYGVRSVWIDHGRNNGGNALLRLPVIRKRDRNTDNGWKTVFRDYSAPIVTACGLSPLPWSQDALAQRPDHVRAGRAVNDRHPIGVGVGPRTFLRLIEHAQNTLGIEPVTYHPTTIRVRGDRDIDGSRLTPQALDAAIATNGYQQLRIVHLSARPESRERIRTELTHYQRPGDPEITPALGTAHTISERAELVVYDTADLLRHGNPDRSQLIEQAPALKGAHDTLVLALVDTEYGAGMMINDDAKPALRRAIGELGAASQFLAIPPHVEDDATLIDAPSAQPLSNDDGPKRDYPAEAAVKDLLMRCGGLTDGRLATAVTLNPHPLDREVWLVGIHVRRQNTSKNNGTKTNTRPRLVSVLVAIQAHPDPSIPSTVRLYRPDTGWTRHPEALAAFYAGSIGPEISPQQEQQAYADLRDMTDTALDELRKLADHPIIVMADADATRRIWHGLTDNHLRTGRLPGDGLPNALDIAVVRINSNDEDIPRPAHRTDGQQSKKDPAQPATPGNRVYELTGDDRTRSCLLGKTSRTYAADQTGRIGASYTRFTLPEEQAAKQGKPWHSFTGTEFVVARIGLLTEDTLLALAARLCAQPISWDGRTRWPVPLHIARIADEDHPYYRTDETSDAPAEERG